jgi:hypothetical protein
MDLHPICSGRPLLLNLVIPFAIAGILAWCLQSPPEIIRTDSGSNSDEGPLMVAASELFILETTQLAASGRGVRVPGAGAALAWADPRISSSPPLEKTLSFDHSTNLDSASLRAPGKIELRL